MNNELTLPTAMAISGAAANPWAGSAGAGVTRNPLVSMLMALMNLRLGCWLPNPNAMPSPPMAVLQEELPRKPLQPGLKEVLGLNLRETSPVCLLSDGGHFENLALYELIRRRLRLIVPVTARRTPTTPSPTCRMRSRASGPTSAPGSSSTRRRC